MERETKNLRTLDMFVRLCEGKTVNKADEARRFGVDERSVQRDIDDIRAFLDERSISSGDGRTIELKTKKLTPEAAGQINMYLNYYAAEVNEPDDNPPIGIILCTDKDDVAAEYALGGLSNQIFASRYVLHMPDKELLIAQVEDVLNQWHNN